ncbi:hypothetical protein [Gordonia hongkongensis]|uniref:hypothetical protein n=1 Tax=Gordonia hongkongensis TaxID=1701090 RepID=UPI003D72F443
MTEPTDDVTPPSNPATALYRIAKTIYLDNPGASFSAALTDALGNPDLGSTEFVRRHAQALNLLDHVRLIVKSTPNLDEHFDLYLPTWHNALAPSADWSTANKDIAKPADIRPIAHLGTTLDAMRVGGGRWDAAHRESFETVVAGWDSLVAESDLPDAVAHDLRRKIEDLRWLLGVVGLFGVAPVVDAAGTLVATGTSAAVRPRTSADTKTKLGVALAITLSVINSVEEVGNAAAGALEGVNAVVTQVRELGDNLAKFGDDPADVSLAPGPFRLENVVDASFVDQDGSGEATAS